MRACHTQGLAGIGAMRSKTLVNRTRMKVVNIALTKIFAVMAGLAPAIHVFLARVQKGRGCPAQGRAGRGFQ